MAFLDGMIAFILADATVAGLIGTRLFPGPNTTQPAVYPYTSWFFIGGKPDYTGDDKVIRNARVQFDHFGTMAQAVATAQAFRKRLEGYVGLFPDATRSIIIDSENPRTSPSFVDPSVTKFSEDFLFQFSDSADAT